MVSEEILTQRILALAQHGNHAKNCILCEALESDLSGYRACYEKMKAALLLIETSAKGSFAKGWTIRVTGYEMDAIRKAAKK